MNGWTGKKIVTTKDKPILEKVILVCDKQSLVGKNKQHVTSVKQWKMGQGKIETEIIYIYLFIVSVFIFLKFYFIIIIILHSKLKSAMGTIICAETFSNGPKVFGIGMGILNSKNIQFYFWYEKGFVSCKFLRKSKINICWTRTMVTLSVLG